MFGFKKSYTKNNKRNEQYIKIGDNNCSSTFKIAGNSINENKYAGYAEETKKYCEYQDKYGTIWNLYGKYEEEINHYYYEFINTNNKDYFNKLFASCQKCIELLPQLEEAKKQDIKTNGTVYTKKPYCVAYEKLAKAYEKVGCYNSAINICTEAISKGYSDGTKSSFEGRIKRLETKLKQTN